MIQHALLVSLSILLCAPLQGMDIAQAVLSDDAIIVKTALENGADANAMHKCVPIITQARSVAVAQLLIDHGAQVQGNDLLHFAMCKNYDPALISLYMRCGCNPLDNNWLRKSPLETLVEHLAISDLILGKKDYLLHSALKKARLLLDAAPVLLNKHREGYLTPPAYIKYLYEHCNIRKYSTLLDLFAQYERHG